jgi:hypothetical protein
MSNRRKKNVDKSSDFESFMKQTADYLPPAIATDQKKSKQDNKLNNKQLDNDYDQELNKQDNKDTNKQVSKQSTSLSALFSETKPKEKFVNTTLQLPQSVNKRFKKLCQKLGKSKNEVLQTLIEALLEEKGF